MTRRNTVVDLIAYAESFEEEFPMKKGYVAKLLIEISNKPPGPSTVLKKIKTFLQTSEPDKCFNYELMLIHLSNFAAILKKKKNL
jgi:hypothetical protein